MDEAVTEPKSFDDFIVTLGDELRGERATRGKSLLDVQRDLRIKAAYISAIENCDPSVFPNRGFVAGYVRSYARYLGLDSDKIFRRFCDESGFESVNSGLKNAQGESRSNEGPSEFSSSLGSLAAPQKESILNAVSPSGLASVFVLVGLIVGIGYGGWAVVKDIQRVEFAPVDQSPGVVAEIDLPALPVDRGDGEIASISTGFDTGVPRSDILSELYRPQELDAPKIEPRDGPIASIDPDTVGVFQAKANTPGSMSGVEITTAKMEEFQGPVVTVDLSPPPVEVVAQRAAWVRVYEKGGSILFEKILEAGERYQIPRDAVEPMMRAGNAGSVFLIVDNQTYGPVGDGTAVAKDIALNFTSVSSAMPVVTNTLAADIPQLRSANVSQYTPFCVNHG